MASSSAASSISTTGKVFFGSLCAGTFGLGCWQLQRLVEKVDKVQDRQSQLAMEPLSSLSYLVLQQQNNNQEDEKVDDKEQQPYRRRRLHGMFRHDREVLIGPRGAPPGVQIPRQGLSARQKGNGASSGMSPGPQGYHVLTPLELWTTTATAKTDGNNYEKEKRIVWINRGWVPRTMVPGNQRPMRGREGEGGRPRNESNDNDKKGDWDRPSGEVQLTTIISKTEKPRFMTPEHNYSKRPLQLFWLDGIALQAIAESKESTILLTQVQEDDNEKEKQQSSMNNKENDVRYPLRPPVSTVGDFKTTPLIHAGYATTWFGLSAAGVYMTRKLLTKGRF